MRPSRRQRPWSADRTRRRPSQPRLRADKTGPWDACWTGCLSKRGATCQSVPGARKRRRGDRFLCKAQRERARKGRGPRDAFASGMDPTHASIRALLTSLGLTTAIGAGGCGSSAGPGDTSTGDASSPTSTPSSSPSSSPSSTPSSIPSSSPFPSFPCTGNGLSLPCCSAQCPHACVDCSPPYDGGTLTPSIDDATVDVSAEDGGSRNDEASDASADGNADVIRTCDDAGCCDPSCMQHDGGIPNDGAGDGG
jgi:hypothetical protein